MTDEPDTGDVVAELWARFLPLVRQRLDSVGAGVAARLDGHGPADPTVAAAADAAHALAGAAGSYGRHEATVLARQLEHVLRDPAPLDEQITGSADVLDRLREALA